MRVGTIGKMGISCLQRGIFVIHIFSYGMPASNVDDNVRIGESTAIECLERFAIGLYDIFEAKYLRPTNEYIEHLLQMGDAKHKDF